MNFRESYQILLQAGRQWNEDRASQMGAALAYYTLFSIAPLLIIAIAIAGLVFGEDAARGQVREQLRETIGADAAGAVQTLLEKATEPTRGVWATVVGGLALLAGA